MTDFPINHSNLLTETMNHMFGSKVLFKLIWMKKCYFIKYFYTIFICIYIKSSYFSIIDISFCVVWKHYNENKTKFKIILIKKKIKINNNTRHNTHFYLLSLFVIKRVHILIKIKYTFYLLSFVCFAIKLYHSYFYILISILTLKKNNQWIYKIKFKKSFY